MKDCAAFRRDSRFLLLLVVVLTPNWALIAAHNIDESQAIAEIERLGGKVKRDDKLPGQPVTGVERFRCFRFENKDLYLLKSLKNLTTLDLSDNPIKDAGFKELAELKNLTTLNLGSTQITDAGFKGLGQLKNLTTLDLSNTQIADTGAKELRELKRLTTLNLSAAPITDESIKALRELTNLTTLDLSSTDVTGAGLRQLRELNHLTAPQA